jgi:ATP-dependent DNA helicase DinG
VQAAKRISAKAIKLIQSGIDDAEGNEVFVLGFLNDKGIVDRVEIAARGNEDSVLALRSRLEEADVLIHNHPSGFLTPSDNDLVIASKAADVGVGSFIVDNAVERVYVIAEPIKKRLVQQLDSDEITAALEEGGSIARRLPFYESRESQLNLMRIIVRGFNEDALVCAEAGTGVGKSFAYLLPSLQYALLNDERIVISTATITLQQQLYEKDIPLVLAGLGKKLKVVLVKGRANYLCLRRLEDAFAEPGLEDIEAAELQAIADWASTTQTGSRSDLSFLPSEGIWSRICSEPDTCLGMRCPQRERCFFMLLRRETADARILVVNHHLLFADLSARSDGAGYDGTVVLPPYKRVIIDEAHTIENAATSFFSEEFSRLGIFKLTGRLYRKRRTRRNGLILRLAAISAEQDKVDDTVESIQKLRTIADELDEAALELLQDESVFRLIPQKDSMIRGRLSPVMLKLRKEVSALVGTVRLILEAVPPANDDDPAVWETNALLRRLEAIGSAASAFMEYKEKPEDIFWIERRGTQSSSRTDDAWVKFTITPLDVAPSLKESLFEPNKTVVCVSATLTIADSFQYWQRRSGLMLMGGRTILSGMFPSPFPYAKAVLLASPQDAALPESGTYRSFIDRSVARLTETSGGSALVLFTSYEALKSAYNTAAPILAQQGIKCLKQGDDDRTRLLQTFLSDESSVLFATDSFWEGVDAPGDTLRLVILCRLPFRPPDDPVFQARSESIDQRGGSSFMELSLPEAVMKFKQGFGRLMRRSSDHGVVVVLDGRILHKRYGEIFLRSLPETKRSFAGFDTMLKHIESFLYP